MEPDSALQERISASLVAQIVGTTYKKTKKVLREVETQLGLAPNALDAYKSWVLKSRIAPAFQQQGITKVSKKKASQAAAAAAAAAGGGGKKKKKARGKAKEPKKKKLKPSSSSLVEGQAEEEDKEEEEEESESESGNDYDYNDGFLNDDEDEEAAAGEQSSSSSDSDASRVVAARSSSKSKRLVMDDDEDEEEEDADGIQLDDDDKLLLQDAVEKPAPSTTKNKRSTEDELVDSKKKKALRDELDDDEDEDEESDESGGGGKPQRSSEQRVEELDSGVSSNEYDTDEEDGGGFVVPDNVPEGEEGERMIRRLRRKARKERRARRAAFSGAFLNQDISDENRLLYDLCFSIENFAGDDLYLDDTEDEVEEGDQLPLGGKDSVLIKVPMDERKLYMTAADGRIRDRDVPERVLLAEAEVPKTVDVEKPGQLHMLVSYCLSHGVLENEQSVEECVKLFFLENKEVQYVHVYCADRTQVGDLEVLWRIYDLGREFQPVFGKFTECVRLVQRSFSTGQRVDALDEDDEDDDEAQAFWEQPLDTDVVPLLSSTDDGDGEEEEKVPRSLQEFWLRRLYQLRHALDEHVVRDFYEYIVCLVNGGTDAPPALRNLNQNKPASAIESNLGEVKACLRHFGSVPKLGMAVKRGSHAPQRHQPETKTPQEFAEECVGDDIVALTSTFCKQLLFKDPHIRAKTRELFREQCTISTKRTPKGKREIADAQNKFYSCCSLVYKPVGEFLNSEHVDNSEQALLLDLGQRDKVLTVTLNADEIAVELKQLLRKYFVRDASDAWDGLREDAVSQCVTQHLVPWGKRETLKLLVASAQTAVKKRLASKFFQRVSTAPFAFASLPVDSFTLESKLVDSTSNTGNFAAVYLSDDPRHSPSFFVCLNADGVVKFHSVIDAQGPNLELSLEKCMWQSEPVVVLVNACSKTKLVVRVLNQLADKLYGEVQKKKHKDLAERWKGWFASFVCPNDDVASAFAMSEAGQREFAKDHINMRRCVAMIRSTLCFPLPVWTGLMGDLSISKDLDRNRVPLLSLSLHALQEYIAPEQILVEYERVLLNVVALAGVDVNKAILFDFYSSVLRFAPGLGFRKAQHLLKKLKARLVKGRGDLRNALGAQVFDSCVGFLKIAKISDRQQDDEDEGGNEDEDDYEEDGDQQAIQDDDSNDDEDGSGDSDDSNDSERKSRKSQPSGPKIRRSCLDRTRVHPNDFSIAVAVCERYCQLLHRGETGESALRFTMNKLKLFHDASFLLQRQRDVYDVFAQSHTVHLLPDVANKGLQDQLPEVEVELCDGRDGKYFANLFTVRLIVEELRFPFGDKRCPFRPPSETETAALCLGEDVATLQVGAEVQFRVEQMPTEQAYRRISGRMPGSGFKIDLNLLDGDVVDRTSSQFSRLDQLLRNVQQHVSALPELVEYLGRDFGLSAGAVVDVTIREIDFALMRIKAKLKPKPIVAVDSILNDLFGGGGGGGFVPHVPLHWDPYFAPFDFAEDKPQAAASSAASAAPASEFRARNIPHAMFQNVSTAQADEVLRNGNLGDVVLRPSPAGFTKLVLSWRCSKDPVRVEHLELVERNRNGGPKDGNDPNLGAKLVLRDREYDDVDEIVATFIEPIAALVREIAQFKYYRPFSVDETEGLTRDLRAQNPNGSYPYFVCPHATQPRLYYLVYQCTSRPKRIRFVARPHGLEMANKTYKDLKALIHYFKTHLKELEIAVADLAKAPQVAAVAGFAAAAAPVAPRASRWGQEPAPLPNAAFLRYE